jgi:uncharacterized protein (TIGR03067 family)
MTWRLALLACACTAVSAPGGGDDSAKSELKKLQGTWKVTRMEVDGTVIPLQAFAKVGVRIEEDRMTFQDQGKPYDVIEITVRPTKQPRQIDLHYVAGLKKGVKEEGIYELDGDTLKICQSLNAKKQRPTDLQSPKGAARQLMILKHVK